MNIFVGEEKSTKKLRLAKSVKFLSKGRVNCIRVGHVPCRYVKLEFVKNKLRPGPTIYAIRFVGMLSETVEQELPSSAIACAQYGRSVVPRVRSKRQSYGIPLLVLEQQQGDVFIVAKS